MWSSASRPIRNLLLTTCLICLPCIGSAASFRVNPQTPAEADVVALVKEFFGAYAKRDPEGLLRFWSERSPELAGAERTMRQLFAATDKVEVKTIVIRKVSVSGDRAAVSAAVEMEAAETKTGKPVAGFGKMNRSLLLVKEKAGWQLWRNVPAESELADRILTAKTDQQRKNLLAEDPALANGALLRSIFDKGISYRADGKYSDALATYSIAQDIAKQINDRPGVAGALNNAAIVYQLQGDYLKALELLDQALAIRVEINNKGGIASSFLNLGGVHRFLGDYDQSLACYNKSIALSDEIGDRQMTAKTLNNVGIIYELRGDLSTALMYYEKSLALKKEVGDKNGMVSPLENIATLHYRQGNTALALDLANQALELAEQLRDKAGIALCLNALGEIYQKQDDNKRALEFYQKSLDIVTERGEKALVAQELANIALLEAKQGQFASALERLEKSVEVATALDAKEQVAVLLSDLASVYSKHGDYLRAGEVAERAITLASQINLREEMWYSWMIAGKAHQAAKSPALARQCYDQAISIVETLRSQTAGGEQERELFFEDKVAPYHLMVELLLDENKPEEALSYAERAKSRVLVDVLRRGRANLTRTMSSQESDRERKLTRELVGLNTQISRENLLSQPDQARVADLQERLRKARLDLDEFRAALYAAHQELRTQRGEGKAFNADDVAHVLSGSNEILLEYVVTTNKTFLFAISGTDDRNPGNERASQHSRQPALQLYAVSIGRKDLAARVEAFRTRLASHDLDYADQARALYDLLVGPCRQLLRGKTHVVVVPDDALWDLPFQALQPAKGRFLIEDHAISYAPSLSTLREMTRLRKARIRATAEKSLIAVGNPELGKGTVERAKRVMMDEKLEPLPEAERQVKALGQLYGPNRSAVYVGAQAREDTVKAQAGKCRILHLATHGVLNDASPLYSHVVLSQTSADANEDGLLEAWEIMNLDLNVELVVLSACETARGRIGSGEGVIGLTWALFVAGCPSTVVSQWSVDSASTTELMVEFHRNLGLAGNGSRSPLSKPEALRRAEMKLLENKRYRHPFFWAPFVVIGDGT